MGRRLGGWRHSASEKDTEGDANHGSVPEREHEIQDVRSMVVGFGGRHHLGLPGFRSKAQRFDAKSQLKSERDAH